MKFPKHERVIYEKNPLVEVILQIRMPRNLEIERQLPVEFQKAVRANFPILETRTEQISFGAIPTPEELGRRDTNTLYDFVSKDRNWKLTLGSQFFALATNKYTRWEEFRELSEKAIGWVVEYYNPPLFTRIGLRYKDVISRKRLGLDGVLWRDLLSPAINGVLGSVEQFDGEAQDISMCHSTARFIIEGDNVTLNHGLVQNNETGETGYMIDADFSTQAEMEPEISSALGVLNGFNSRAGRIFRWTITERLHNAMEPKPA